MEFRQLRYFVKVAELRSFSEASKALFISQSTLSQQIKQLEEELGVELLVRDSRHVSMSDYGEQYLPYAKQVLKDVDTSTERMNDVRQLKIGTLNVGATYTFCPLLADTVRDYMKKYPGIKLKIYCRSMENLMEMLEHGQLDVALSYKPLQSYDDIDSHILFNSNLCVIAGKDNPVAKKERIRLAELENLPLVLPAKGLQARNAFDSLLYGQNFKFDVRLEINDLSMLLDMVSRTNLVTLLSGATIHSNKNFVAISLDHPHSEMQGSFHLLKGTYCKNATKEFLKMLVENNSFLMAMEAIANR
ncbi:MAG: LysR substrate-binding domain-containing protein [Bacteroides sp.]|nr:LysR family transcriptional regulator [Bacteroidales bacterium]MCI6680241.1 LysR substrate-binding domain-containing protein [Bacteroides sp.]MDY2859433.1 LysR substrate-binding domain-containing protein [Candidatus Cryptobacteroides sp.]MCI7461470.1 LysR substrate-binding domain-containing protein [Bacteroides sp.]MDD7118230.1 LysR substrate-binding domain-containing protein [Bacteroidales bacterium]